MNNISSALNAYQQALSRIGSPSQASTTVTAENTSAKDNFQSLVATAVQGAEKAAGKAEEMSLAGIAGKADIQDVVLAVSNAEVALETVVAVRDTAIKAYEEIMRMTI
jgi:flagellar hook-basal body complex protein FliE